ncbi:hypothetical protein [Fibrobacter sp. UBA2449]|jgi:hypothetical protein|uniref:hypothetical protein n=1 Tax=Fibrobacter sp. UBA2449 TaxID=1946529 RepID=UPI0025BCFCEA|nr:hypothetical protein [Fibrobacter sp. UBA2449]
MLIQDGKIRKIHAISEAKVQEIKHFFQGAIRCHDKVAVGEWFSLRDLMGGENFDWNGTPLQELFEAYRGRSDALKMAAKSAGWLLKAAIKDDPYRRYETKKEAFTRKYRWVKE